MTRNEQIALVAVIAVFIGGIIWLERGGGSARPRIGVRSGDGWQAIGEAQASDGAPKEDRSSTAESSESDASAGAQSESNAPDGASWVDLNHASAEELDRLPGIGEVKAQAIIAYRERVAPFGSVADLANVSGFSSKTVDRLRPYLTVDGANATVERSSADQTDKPGDPFEPVIDESGDPFENGAEPSGATKIDINEADSERLQLIPGVGPRIAERIIAYRERRRFRRPEDLIRIRGIGPNSFEPMRPWVRVGH